MAKNTKTPVMVLQELTVKKGYDPPEYNLVYSVQGTHKNEFHYQVYVHNVMAKGKGRSKKEAKHEAAHVALDMLAEEGIYHPDVNLDMNRAGVETSPIKAPENCIPKLNDICVENKIPMPEFREISAVGPPHCREFTYECHIASIITRATAGSKKHAKQLTAREMLDRLISVIPEIKEQYESDQLRLTETNAEVLDKFNDLTQFSFMKTNFNIKITDYHLEFKKLMNERNLKQEDVLKYFYLPRTEETLERLLNLFELKSHTHVIQEIPAAVVISINCDAPLATISVGKTIKEATSGALNQLFTTLEAFLN